jgi:hypothetical protein
MFGTTKYVYFYKIKLCVIIVIISFVRYGSKKMSPHPVAG